MRSGSCREPVASLAGLVLALVLLPSAVLAEGASFFRPEGTLRGAVVCAAGPAQATDKKRIRVNLFRFDPLQREDGTPAVDCAAEPDGGNGGESLLVLVQLGDSGQPCASDGECTERSKTDWSQALPGDAYLLRRTPRESRTILKLPGVRAVCCVGGLLKIDPALFEIDSGAGLPRNGARELKQRLNAPEFYPLEVEVRRAGAAADSCDVDLVRVGSKDELLDIANRSDVDAVRRPPRPAFRNSTTSWVIQSNEKPDRSVFDMELRGEGQVIGLIDGPVDRLHCFFSNARPSAAKFLSYLGYGSSASPNHGTHVAGIVAGQDWERPSSPVNGQAPAAQLRFTDIASLSGAQGACPSLYSLFQKMSPCDRPAVVFSNSWGDDTTSSYSSLAYDVDKFTWDNEDAVVVFATSNRPGVRTPENAKNVIAVGATQQADRQDTLAGTAAGPTGDGRRKPDLVAPGCWIYSAQAGTSCRLQSSEAFGGLLEACATSWAAPAVAGAAALVREYFLDGFYPTGSRSWTPLHPSGALVRAMLLNGTVDVAGNEAGSPSAANYPSDAEGWGRLLLDKSLYFAPDAVKTWVGDRRRDYGLMEGQTCQYSFTVGAGEPFKATLVWTDAPVAVIQSIAASKRPLLVNDFDLWVKYQPQIGIESWYIGNQFSGVESTPLNQLDERKLDRENNVEQVLVSTASRGTYTVYVKARDIRASFDGRADAKKQGFAVVVTGALAQPTEQIPWDCSVDPAQPHPIIRLAE